MTDPKRSSDISSGVHTLIGTQKSKDNKTMVVIEKKLLLGLLTLYAIVVEGGSTSITAMIKSYFGNM